MLHPNSMTSRSVRRTSIIRTARAAVEMMEPRRLLSTYTVDTLSDAANPGAGLLTLRQAIADANAHAGSDTIAFSSTVFAPGTLHTITLSGTELTLTDTSGTTTITGPGSSTLAISGDDGSRVLYINSNVAVAMTGVQITGGGFGQGAQGGGIYSAGTLSLADCILSDNGGNNNYSIEPTEGGAIYSTGSLTIANTTVSGNSAISSNSLSSQGGGIFSTGNLSIADSTISGNGSFGDAAVENGTGINASGGGIYSTGVTSIISSTVSSNTCYVPESTGSNIQPGNASGGGIYAKGPLTLTGDNITGNTLTGSSQDTQDSFTDVNGASFGGGVWAAGTTGISNTTITGNQASGGHAGYYSTQGSAEGGGVFTTGAMTVTGSTISGNSATPGRGNGYNGAYSDGGGIFSEDTLTISSSTISGNTVGKNYGNESLNYTRRGPQGDSASGGGIYDDEKLTITNSTVANNSVVAGDGGSGSTGIANNITPGGNGGNASGGGIYASGGLTVSDSTVTGNSTTAATGGAGGNYNGVIYANGLNGVALGSGVDIHGGTTVLNNSIVSGDVAGTAHDIDGTVSSSSGGDLIGTGSGLTNGLNKNQVGVTNPKLGALTSNGGPTATMAPLTGSPAIDAGNNALIPSGIVTDQRGAARIYNGTVDIGAVEFSAQAPLTGTLIGTTGSYANSGNISANAFDGNLSTFFDANQASGAWAGLDLGMAAVVSKISFAPRSGWAARMVGGVFQASNSANFSSGVVTLYTVNSAPLVGSLTTVQISNSTAFRYVRYLGPANGYCDIAEVQFFSSGTVATTGSIAVSMFNDFNGDGLREANDTPEAGFGCYLDLNHDGVFDGSDIKLIADANGNVVFTNLAPGVYYVRQDTPAGYKLIVPSEFPLVVTVVAGQTTSVTIANQPPPTKLTGTVIGTAGSYNNQGNTIAKVFDGNLTTYFDAPSPSGDWVGLDLGTAQVVNQIQYAPRSGLASRMVGGMIQASNFANFSTGVVTLYTITTSPAVGVLTIQSITNATAYRYYRYLGPNDGYCNIAELEFDT